MIKNRVHVAVVEDDESFGRAVTRLLTVAEFDAVLYSSAEAFLGSPALPKPDCLLLDIELGGMSGLDLGRLCVAQGRGIPLIFLTASDEPAIREEAEQIGCASYFRKPVPGKSLIQAITSAVQSSSHPEQES